MVVNAGCREKDLAHICKHLKAFQACFPARPFRPQGCQAAMTLTRAPRPGAGLVAGEGRRRRLAHPRRARPAGAAGAQGSDSAAGAWASQCARRSMVHAERDTAPQGLTKANLSTLYFGMFATFDVAGVPCFVTRTGYTGEDGFEISIPNEAMFAVAEKLVSADGVRLCGAPPAWRQTAAAA